MANNGQDCAIYRRLFTTFIGGLISLLVASAIISAIASVLASLVPFFLTGYGICVLVALLYWGYTMITAKQRREKNNQLSNRQRKQKLRAEKYERAAKKQTHNIGTHRCGTKGPVQQPNLHNQPQRSAAAKTAASSMSAQAGKQDDARRPQNSQKEWEFILPPAMGRSTNASKHRNSHRDSTRSTSCQSVNATSTSTATNTSSSITMAEGARKRILMPAATALP